VCVGGDIYPWSENEHFERISSSHPFISKGKKIGFAPNEIGSAILRQTKKIIFLFPDRP
jgi:hypothetical protein